MRALVNEHVAPAEVAAPVTDAAAFHRTLDGYGPTPVRELDDVALSADPGCRPLRDAVGPHSRALLIAREGRTGDA